MPLSRFEIGAIFFTFLKKPFYYLIIKCAKNEETISLRLFNSF